jgi:hypothetical protein
LLCWKKNKNSSVSLLFAEGIANDKEYRWCTGVCTHTQRVHTHNVYTQCTYIYHIIVTIQTYLYIHLTCVYCISVLPSLFFQPSVIPVNSSTHTRSMIDQCHPSTRPWHLSFLSFLSLFLLFSFAFFTSFFSTGTTHTHTHTTFGHCLTD